VTRSERENGGLGSASSAGDRRAYDRVRNRDHSYERNHDPRQSRHEMEKDKEERFHNLIKGRVDDMIQKIESSSLKSEEISSIRQEILDYYQLELKLIQSRAMISADFEKARTIKDKNERRAFLDKAKEEREIRRIEDNRIRDIVIQKREYLQELVKEKTSGSGSSEL
jgi:hypothetical protein